jgi:hypothetical protein
MDVAWTPSALAGLILLFFFKQLYTELRPPFRNQDGVRLRGPPASQAGEAGQ